MQICFQVNAIVVDGKLDDIEWQQIKAAENFTTVTPFSLTTPDYKTEVKLYSDDSGIYIAIVNHQPKSVQRSKRTARDAHMDADYNNIVLDFDHSALNAYSFTVANGGSIEDGIYRNENDYSYEWNGVWYSQTSSDDEHWYSEIHIPWDVAPMASVSESKRKVGLYVSRHVAHLAKTYANAPIKYNRQRFMSDFTQVVIDDHSTSSLQTFGYASIRRDMVNNESSMDIGLDLFWKPTSNKQLSLAFNPDFGHVESDELVVNFSPTETFFSENRPFFTENQGLFDVRGTESLRLVHTRRIGAKPDVGNSIDADLNGAVKFTSVGDKVHYGFFSAIEDSDGQAKGRRFYTARAITKQSDYSLGYLLNYTDRPDINRTATVNSVDYSYDFNKDIKLSGQVIQSQININTEDKNDSASWLKLEHQLNNNWTQTMQFSYYGDQLEVNDLGYLPRNDLVSANYVNSWKKPIVTAESQLKEYMINFEVEHQENTEGLNIATTMNIANTWSYKDSSSIMAKLTLDNGGHDDLLTRGNNVLAKDDGHQLELLYYGANQSQFSYHLNASIYNQSVRGKGYTAHLHSTYFFNDNYSVDFGGWYTDADNWLIWQQANEIIGYSRKQFLTRLNFNAAIDDKQELSFKFEWLALNATAQASYEVDGDGRLISSQNVLDDFSLSDTAIQLRYRYEIAPLSNIYLVYSRGGSALLAETDSFNSLFRQGWDERQGDNFLVKVRYQF